MKRIALALALLTLAPPAFATGNETQPTADETASINATLAKFGCAVDKNPIVKEDNGLFEIDDATCDGMPYDVKLDAQFHITLLSKG